MSDSTKRAACALCLLAETGLSPSAAARRWGRSRQRWHQRLKVAKKNGWVTPEGELTPRGVSVVESLKRQVSSLESSGVKVNWDDILAGPWSGVV